MFGSSDNSSSIVAPRTNMSHSRKQFDFQCFPSTVTLYTRTRRNPSASTPPLRMTRDTGTHIDIIACGEKFFARMVVLVLNSGLKNDTLGKNGEERRNCFVAGTGYKPARWKTAKLPIAPLSGSMIANDFNGGGERVGLKRELPSLPGNPFTDVLKYWAIASRERRVLLAEWFA
jgi:hypothetical protein